MDDFINGIEKNKYNKEEIAPIYYFLNGYQTYTTNLMLLCILHK